MFTTLPVAGAACRPTAPRYRRRRESHDETRDEPRDPELQADSLRRQPDPGGARGARAARHPLRQRRGQKRRRHRRARRRRAHAADPAPVHDDGQADLRHAPRHRRISHERVSPGQLPERLAKAQVTVIHPLLMRAHDSDGDAVEFHAFNDVFLYRQTYQAARLRILIDGEERLSELVADGVLVATPAGSTAYNLSVQGPIIPISAPLMALTPISPF